MIRSNISIIAPDEMSENEIKQYIDYIETKYKKKLEYINIQLNYNDLDFVNLTYKFMSIPFERIRRITGYLTGDMGKWNDAKYQEEKDRVKHTTCTTNLYDTQLAKDLLNISKEND